MERCGLGVGEDAPLRMLLGRQEPSGPSAPPQTPEGGGGGQVVEAGGAAWTSMTGRGVGGGTGVGLLTHTQPGRLGPSVSSPVWVCVSESRSGRTTLVPTSV